MSLSQELAALTLMRRDMAEMAQSLRKASQLASIASDWNLPEVEIDGEMVSVYDLKNEFDAAAEKAGAA